MEYKGQFFVKTDQGTLAMSYDMDITLNQLKDIIEDKINYPREVYFLKYNGRPMYEDKKLKEYGVEKDGTIEISIRNIGTIYPKNSVLIL